jgi:hypothetical protein
MHAHGIHHIQQLPLQPMPRGPASSSKTSATRFVLPSTTPNEDDANENSISVDPNTVGQGETAALTPTKRVNPLTSQQTDPSEALTPDLTVEPLIYGAGGKIKSVQKQTGRLFDAYG